MSIVLGFGSTEKQVESSLEKVIKAFVKENFEIKEGYFTESFTNKVKNFTNKLAEESNELAEKYKKATTHPERYSYFFPTVVGDATRLMFLLKMHHINRRHPLSPDGWALMQSEVMFYVSSIDLELQAPKKAGAL